MSVASFAASFSSLRTFFRDSSDSYVSSKSLSTSTPSLLFGRSRTWPIDAITLKSRPRYLLMVFAFAGDSTTTSDFAISPLLQPFAISPFDLTLARSVNPDESSAADSRHGAVEFQLEQTRQQPRRTQPGSLGNLVEIAGFA